MFVQVVVVLTLCCPYPAQESDEIQFESYARIEHVITGYWLHAMRGNTALRHWRYWIIRESFFVSFTKFSALSLVLAGGWSYWKSHASYICIYFEKVKKAIILIIILLVSTLVQIMACRLFRAKPLPEPMLGYIKRPQDYFIKGWVFEVIVHIFVYITCALILILMTQLKCRGICRIVYWLENKLLRMSCIFFKICIISSYTLCH